MDKYFRDTIIQFKQEILRPDEDIFSTILEERKGKIDSERFFLEYLPIEIASNYNFDDPKSLDEFRDGRLRGNRTIMRMGGCNLHPDYLEKDKVSGSLRYAGIKMSNPYGKILGSFDMRDKIVTYSPIFPHFYDERDLCKFARDTYFTTMKFEDIMKIQIDNANECFVHVGNSYKLGVNCPYILQKVTKDQMMAFVCHPEEGEKVLEKVKSLRMF